MNTYASFFAGAAAVEASAPGRVSLLGEYSGFSDGCVLSVAAPMHTHVNVAASQDDAFHFYSQACGESVVLGRRGHLASGFGRYIEGCIRILEKCGHEVPPLRVFVQSDIPLGTGLSAGASLQVATLRAIRCLLGLQLSEPDTARLAQKAEMLHVGAYDGIVRHMAVSLCTETSMLFVDSRTQASKTLPLPPGAEVLVAESCVPRADMASVAQVRHDECNQAARALGSPSLSETIDMQTLASLAPPLRRRALHVVSENARVERGASGVNARELGALMDASRDSLRDDYEVSIEPIEALCDLLRATPGVYGARFMGAGLSGACVALCEQGQAARIGSAVMDQYQRSGRAGRVLLPATHPEQGAPP